MSLLAVPPLALYVHLPWCVRKCPYCDFNSHVAPSQLPQRQYIDALLEDLEQDLPAVAGRSLVSIFLGGGTPSLFDEQSIASLLTGVRARIACEPDLEVTMEANPGALEHGRFSGYREAGVTRVSLGAQSFDTQKLRALGRIHDVADIYRAVEALREASIDDFNLDLMYALPQQTVDQALADLKAAIELQPTHLSHYQLTLEPGTAFHHRPPRLPDEDTSWEMQVASQRLLAAQGFEHYEVSAYARAGRRCRHNLNYWRFGDYIGIGAGAHGKLTDAARGVVVRTVRQRRPREYLRRAAAERISERIVVTPEALAFEFMLNALRLASGFTTEEFERRTGVPWRSIQSQIEAAIDRKLLAQEGERWCPTALGRRFLNDLQCLFLPDHPSLASSALAGSGRV